jgi:dihydrofolate reductase
MNNYEAIAALSLNRVIGNKGEIPWHLPKDFKWFREKTLGNTLLMGRKTYESIGKPLPGRTTIVLSRQESLDLPEGVIHIHTPEALSTIDIQGTLFVCGGAEIYKRFLPQCSDLYLTCVNQKVEGDTFFPEFESLFVPVETLMEENDFKIVHYVSKAVFEQPSPITSSVDDSKRRVSPGKV